MRNIAGPHRHNRCFQAPGHDAGQKAGVEVYRYARQSADSPVRIWRIRRVRKGIHATTLRIIAAFSTG